MKVRFTYKEFTLIAGILVAMIIMLALWLAPADSETTGLTRKLIPTLSKPAAKALVEKTAVLITNILQ
jgi:hypothetical protein